MSTKQEIIQKMIQMQKQFMALERKSGVAQEDYFVPQSGDILVGYRLQPKNPGCSVSTSELDQLHFARRSP